MAIEAADIAAGLAFERRHLRVVGLMSGTSLDGIDAALLTSDGEEVGALGPARTARYPEPFRDRLRTLLGREPRADAEDRAVIEELTDRHAEAVLILLSQAGLTPADVDLVGFHGQTVLHRPDRKQTVQIGCGPRLAAKLGVPVVCDFRSADVKAGGQGAPLVPLYHAALARDLPRPLAVLNIGGVANVTWIGDEAGSPSLLAFDTGPGNALLDDFVLARTGQPCDVGGARAAAGRIDGARVMAWLRHPWFRRPSPKSLDRNDFRFVLDAVADLSPADGAATLTAFTARAVALALPTLPAVPKRWLVCGGGRHNETMMQMLADQLGGPVEPVEAVGWRGDFMEAEAFAFLAVRAVRRLPLTLPTTTGIARPLTGGTLYLPN
jgi:anhydro-N-acetylmuramic acid kinase